MGVLHVALPLARRGVQVLGDTQVAQVSCVVALHRDLCNSRPIFGKRELPGLVAQQLSHRLKLLHALSHHLHDDRDRHAQQHAPDAPQPCPEQQ